MIRMLILISTMTLVNGMSLNLQKSQSKSMLSRRGAFSVGVASISAATGVSFIHPKASRAIDIDIYKDLNGSTERINLLQKIMAKDSDEEISAAIVALEQLDPSNGKAAISDQLDGTWKLIYSMNAEAFSPLLNLPELIRPSSLQLVGNDAATVVGSGRIAQILNFPILPLTFILSSGAKPVEMDPSALEIFPPFRFEIKIGSVREQVVESGSDADFRTLNGRTKEAQASGRNIYKQRYLETSGKKGDLRISEVIAGDPVIVGAVFIHMRI